MQHDLYHRIFGHEHKANEKIPDFPRDLFVDEATHRVHLSLLYVEYLNLHGIKIEQDKVHASLDDIASAYEDANEAKQWYLSNKQRLADIENLLTEEAAADKILESANRVLKKLNFRETMEFANNKTAGDKQ